jgi:hypothetical protein
MAYDWISFGWIETAIEIIITLALIVKKLVITYFNLKVKW